jgi:hypothetical protein
VVIINLKSIFPPTALRVNFQTNPKENKTIKNQTIENLNIYKNSSDDIISSRIDELNSEWDTEKILETNAATVVILSSILGFKSNRWWFIVSGFAGFFLLQHALHGWCPPLPLIRKMGVRTANEINDEKIVLKMIRKDFSKQTCEMSEMLDIAQKQ